MIVYIDSVRASILMAALYQVYVIKSTCWVMSLRGLITITSKVEPQKQIEFGPKEHNMLLERTKL